MIQPCVLPSNSSPLVGGSDPAPRILQEHSGNRQHHDFRFSQDYEPKCATLLLSENTQPRLPVKPQPVYHIGTQHPLRSGFARPSYGRSHYTTPAEKDERADRLYKRFYASEGYAKYRARQVKNDKNGEQKWPDHLEQAFFRALVEYPPVGRKKSLFKEKQRGRNELIADWIEVTTGHKRNRKQVSSHIQVLKPFVIKDSLVMGYLSKDEDKKSAHPDSASRYPGAYFPNHADCRGLSRYPVQAPPQSGRQVLPLSLFGISGTHARLKDSPDIFEPVDFEMFVQRKLPDERVERLHTYTRHISQPWLADEAFSDWNIFAQKYPGLAAINAQRPIDCNIVAAQASLAIHQGPWKGQNGEPVNSGSNELGISFHCRAGTIARPFDVIYQSNFFERGELIMKTSSHQEFLKDDGNANNDMQVMFGSTYWVRALSARYKEACENGPEHGAAFIGGITATQDVFVKTTTGMERVLLIHWSFRQSRSEQGRTSWRRVILPSSSASSASHFASPLKSTPVDSPFNFNDDPMPHLTASGAPPEPALQSPFEYNGGSGAVLSSNTWPTTISDAGGVSAFAGTTLDVNLDSTFDFSTDNMDISYDPNLTLDNFDTSTFNFDPTAEDFVPDASMQDYVQSWVGSYAGNFDSQQSFAETTYTTSTAVDSQNGSFDDYGAFDPQIYGDAQESQAYGGAGQEIVIKEESLALAEEAPAFAAQAVVVGQETVSGLEDQEGEV
ncbi:hypothetical protein Q7P37_004123 [Cladosporium fusiforme]